MPAAFLLLCSVLGGARTARALGERRAPVGALRLPRRTPEPSRRDGSKRSWPSGRCASGPARGGVLSASPSRRPAEQKPASQRRGSRKF